MPAREAEVRHFQGPARTQVCLELRVDEVRGERLCGAP